MNVNVLALDQMDSHSEQNWRSLRLGDEVRIVRVPSLFNYPHYHNGEWEETFSLIRQLIINQVVLTITEIDEDGRPWIEYESTDSHGSRTSHTLAMDDDSWERVD